MIFVYARRLLTVFLMPICVCVMFFSVIVAKAEGDKVSEETGYWTFPVEGMITDSYGTRSGGHKGMDIGGEIGSPVYSVAKGKVTKSYLSRSYGHVVFIRHENGYETVYAHLENRLVKEQQEIAQGEQVGRLGNTGRSTGAHLHFEIHRGEWTIDKKNAIDPYRVFGHGEVGQLVFAKEKDPFEAVGVAGLPKSESDESGSERKNKVTHVVQKGETLWGISQKYDLPVEDIMVENALESPNIVINQKLLIPAASPKGQYIVKQGDTLYSISMSQGIDMDELFAWNDLKPESDIYPQQVLKVE
jgi:murein DD-endopeptidase MepM/ murein hydrolase activator NlpD